MFLSKHATGMPCGRGVGDIMQGLTRRVPSAAGGMDVMYGCYVT